ncbi:MAG: endonuclease MutS2 [Candidatus Thermofonsia Clade 1 bacterium]|uniref:Endonuclease MutS2 n=1 Tax=Candidatus Thermofonsia Clade 1 bacterium TaxID=2364210 RepID=A0A2M8P0J2_9CHLR|nr:MAG: endonuclease MutS2 [Candidatus Thermofonsia Clade 1 bacterium]
MVMDEKSAHVLELPKILEQLARYASFSGGAECIRALRPTSDLREALDWQRETSEAVALFQLRSDITLGGVRDVREAVGQAARGIILEPHTLLDIRGTLRRATTLKRTLTRLRSQFPTLAGIAERLEECAALQSEISRVLDDAGNVNDSASPKLAIIRRDMRVASERLQSRLQSLLTNVNYAKYLQEQLITQRNGRYVLPLRAEHKGKIPGIVHDQSSSGATLFIEPLVTVELNNAVRELQLAEEDEIRRILRELSALVSHEGDFIRRTVEVLAHLDLVFAKAHYAAQLRATAPKLVGFQPHADSSHPGCTIKLEGARHPLLDPERVVPIDLVLDEKTYILVITGPNTGGKTVALKTVGLLAMMAQCGLHIPANPGAELSVFEGIFADIGDEQSIEQSLSTFSAHMTNTIRILEQATPRSLVILDELGAGTDPTEGSALARAILLHLLERGITTLVTTHHPELKVFSQQQRGVRNASVEFDLQTLRPTYRLIVGIPGRSNALAIASRLGLPESIIETARSMIGVEELITDDLLDELQQTREETRRAREAALAQREEAERLVRELRERLEETEKERMDILAQARRVAERELESVRKEIRKLRHALQNAGQSAEAVKRLEAAAFDVQPNLETPSLSAPNLPVPEDEMPTYRLGETVWVLPLKAEGQITEIGATDVEVTVGRLRVRAKLDEIERRGKDGSAVREKRREKLPERGPSPGLELDLRGARVEESLERVEEYLDAAYLAGLPFVRIIHGKGTGALRKAIRQALDGHPLVSKYQRGDESEGGDGVTVVNLISMS